jgi:hypothetical protein
MAVRLRLRFGVEVSVMAGGIRAPVKAVFGAGTGWLFIQQLYFHPASGRLQPEFGIRQPDAVLGGPHRLPEALPAAVSAPVSA